MRQKIRSLVIVIALVSGLLLLVNPAAGADQLCARARGEVEVSKICLPLP